MPLSLSSSQCGFAPRIGVVRRAETSSYVGVFSDGTDVFAYSYEDGTVGSLIATKDYSGTGITGAADDWAILTTSPLVLAMFANNKVLIWNVTANTFAGPTNLVSGEDGPVSGGGRNGFAYWLRSDGIDDFALYSVDASCSVSNEGGGTLGSPLSGIATAFIFWTGTDGFSPVWSAPPDAGYVAVPAAAFTSDDSWIPGDPSTGEWANWNAGHKIPGANAALAIFNDFSVRAVGKCSSAPALTQILDDTALGSEPLFFCDPSPDGVTALLYTTNGKLARVSHVSPPALVTWIAVDNAPSPVATPDAMFCLD